jgi:hypothetical protein
MTDFKTDDMVQILTEMGTPMRVVAVTEGSYVLAYETDLERDDITVAADQVTGWYDWHRTRMQSEFRRSGTESREEFFALLGISPTADAHTFHAAVSAYRSSSSVSEDEPVDWKREGNPK